jgi:RNA polymerase primary sigma factor
MEHWFESDEMLSLIDKGRLHGYVTIEELLQHLPETLDAEAIEDALSMLETQGVKVLPQSEAAELELRQLSEQADREIEEMESEIIDDVERWWIQQAARTPRLTPERELELARRAHEGDETARDQLIQANLRLVIAIARKYSGWGVPLADLIQEGNLGLIRAVSLYRPEKGTRFSTYAAWWVRHQIRRALQEQSSVVRLPVYLVKTLRRVRHTATVLEQELGRKPTLHEIAQQTGLSVEQVSNLLNAVARPISLETPVGDSEEITMLDLLAEAPPPEIGEELDLEHLLSVLSEKEREVIRLRYGLDGIPSHTLEEIAQRLGLSRERVRQLEARAIEKLRKAVGS